MIRAAELGSVVAQRDLAVCYVWGEHPFKTDWAQVRYWYLRAADQGDQESQIAVGSMMVQGDGGPVNQAEGLSLLETAASGPDPKDALAAARQLARYYSGAYGVPVDEGKTAEWRAKAEAG